MYPFLQRTSWRLPKVSVPQRRCGNASVGSRVSLLSVPTHSDDPTSLGTLAWWTAHKLIILEGETIQSWNTFWQSIFYISIYHTHNIANCNSRLGIGFPSAMAASSLVVMVCQGIPSFWPMSGSKSMGIRGCRWMFVKQYHKPPFWWFIPPISLAW